MRRRRSRSSERGGALVGLVVALLASRTARAQSCCAGTTAVTPGRLAMHEDALVGLQLHAATVHGSWDDAAHYAGSPSGVSELDFEEDLFGAVRVLGKGQLALLVPFVQTRRATRTITEAGGGIGDVNASARYDFIASGESSWAPGIALLAGITFPTGRAVEDASPDHPLATDATGVGAFQGNLGLALEKGWGPITVTLTGLVATRAPRTVQGLHVALDPQWTALAAGAYSFENDASIALFSSFTAEGDASIDHRDAPGTARHLVRVGVAGLYPLTDHWKLLGSALLDPPLSSLGRNTPATAGLTFTVVRSW